MSEIREHDKTFQYVEDIKSCLKFYLYFFGGDISELAMNKSLYEDYLVVDHFSENNVSNPVYGDFNDLWDGLTFCIDYMWSTEIYIKSYSCIGAN